MIAPPTNQIVLLLARIEYNHSENTFQHSSRNGDGAGDLGMGPKDKELANLCSMLTNWRLQLCSCRISSHDDGCPSNQITLLLTGIEYDHSEKQYNTPIAMVMV